MSISKVKTTRQGWSVYMHDVSLRCMDKFGFTVKTCGKCGGEGYLAGYEFSDGARCWGCNGNGFMYSSRSLTARQSFDAAKRDRKTIDLPLLWKQGGIKVETDISELMLKQVAAYNEKINNKIGA